MRRQDLRELKDCKVIPGESIASQHRLLVASMEFKAHHKKQQRARVKKIKWYILKQQEKKDELALRLAEHMRRRKEKEETTWEDICHMINTNAKEILGETSGGKYVERESWWWNDDVQKAVKEKRDSFKKWQSSRTTEDLADYRENKTNAKKAVTTAKDAGYEELYTKLDSREGQDMIYKLAKTRYRRTLDQEDIVYITDERKHIITDPKRIIGRWLVHFKHLLNIENERDGNMTEVTQREDEQHTVIEPFELVEVAKQMKKMQNNKACGPDGVPTESLRLVDKIDPLLICDQMNDALEKGIPTVWRTSILTPLYKGKGNVTDCNNYRGIKLMCHGMKLFERLVEDRLRQVIEISSTQYGFQQGKSTTEPIFALRMMQEKHLEKRQDLHMIFVDLEKVYDRVPRDIIWWALRKKNVGEEYIKVIQDMYDGCTTSVRTLIGSTESFEVKVGLHQGSALSPLLFITVMDVISKEVGRGPPHAMLFADDLVLCESTREEAEEQLEVWRNAIENKGLRVSRKKTEYLPPSSCHDKVKLGGEEIKNVTTFKYLGSMFDAEGGTTTDCKNRVRLAWNKWREVTGVICDKKVPVKLKHKIYKTVIRPTMTYGAECWTMKKKDEMLMNKTEMRMLRWIQGVSLREHKRNEEIREAATVQPIATHLMQKRLRWYGHVRRRDECHTTRTVLDMVVEGVRPRGRPKLRYMDTIRRDIKKNALTDVNILDRKNWRLAVSRATH